MSQMLMPSRREVAANPITCSESDEKAAWVHCTRLTTSCSSRSAAFSPARARHGEAADDAVGLLVTNDLPIEGEEIVLNSPLLTCTDATACRVAHETIEMSPSSSR